MPGWATRTSSCAAHSRARGPIYRQRPSCHTMRRMATTPRRPTVVISLAGVLIASLTGVFSASQGASQGTSVPQPSQSQIQLATIKQYCAGCHNDRTKAAGVSFEGLTPERIGQQGELFEK